MYPAVFGTGIRAVAGAQGTSRCCASRAFVSCFGTPGANANPAAISAGFASTPASFAGRPSASVVATTRPTTPPCSKLFARTMCATSSGTSAVGVSTALNRMTGSDQDQEERRQHERRALAQFPAERGGMKHERPSLTATALPRRTDLSRPGLSTLVRSCPARQVSPGCIWIPECPVSPRCFRSACSPLAAGCRRRKGDTRTRPAPKCCESWPNARRCTPKSPPGSTWPRHATFPT